ncbi:SDR family NAD(P)-dependent oxidoreductase [Peribacillus simplex]|uniref:SDR family NAD(P)-dependent oxidoreductase n=1 Tax=Peribacillus simplex TaxID=1478 RepID=UPI001E57A390|nr:SDR family NAD(P)-dependent oxidoreductase [Peribacillus simplex]
MKALLNHKQTDISYVVADVTNKDDVQAVVDFAVEKYGRVDVLFNNAGIMSHAPLSEARLSHQERKILSFIQPLMTLIDVNGWRIFSLLLV